MTDPFLDRLREAVVEPSDSDVNVLRAGATAAASELTPERALTLVRLAHHRDVTDEALADARSRLNAKGQAVPEHGGEQLIATLAAEALIISFSRTRFATGHLPALAVRCATSVGWSAVHPDVNTHALSYLSHRSLLVRERSAVPPEPKRPQDAADDWQPSIEDRLSAVRDVVTMDRWVNKEREALNWWLLANSCPSTPLAVALEIYSCVVWIPEPLAAREMLRAKLSQPRFDSAPSKIDVPEDIASLCPDITEPATGLEDDEEYQATVQCMNQLMLRRAYTEAVKR